MNLLKGTAAPEIGEPLKDAYEGAQLTREFGANLFDAPDGAAFIERTLFANECRCGTRKNPDVIVGGLFANQRSNYSGHAAEFNVEQEVDGLSLGSADRERNFAGGLD